jgi:hypothetical protein
MLSELQRGCDVGEDEWVVAIDSTVVRAHHHAAGARLEPPGDVPAQVLAVALAEELAKSLDADQDAAAVPEPVTGGWIESHEFSTVTGQTR